MTLKVQLNTLRAMYDSVDVYGSGVDNKCLQW